MTKAAFDKILVADNGSSEAERAVEVAVSLAANLRAKLVLLGVLAPPSAESQAEGYGLDNAEKQKKLLQEKFSRLQAAAQQGGLSLDTEIVAGDPEEMIERRAEAEGADLIVVGHRDATRLRRWLEGSTSESLVKKSKVSVLVVHDGGGE